MEQLSYLVKEWNSIQLIRSYKQRTGAILEDAGHIALSILKLTHSHNPFNEDFSKTDQDHRDIDSRIPVYDGELGIEYKNEKDYDYYTPSWKERHITSRFKGEDYDEKIVVISHYNKSFDDLRKRFRFIELGFQIKTFGDFMRAIHSLVAKFYYIKKRFFSIESFRDYINKEEIVSNNRPLSSIYSSNYLTNSTICNNRVCNSTVSNTNLIDNNKNNKNGAKVDPISDINKPLTCNDNRVNPLVRWIFGVASITI